MNIPAATIKSRLAGRHVVVSGNTTGTVTGVEVRQRSTASQRIVVVRVTLTSGVVDVIGWSNVRGVFAAPGTPAIPSICSATPVTTALGAITNPSLLETYTNSSGGFGGVYSTGGGFGHNVGMSQYGAHGRALAGQTFMQILKAYYTGIDVGSYPIRIGREPGSGPPTLRQEFYAPNAQGTLEIRSASIKGLNITINGTFDITLRAEELSDGVESIDLSPYLTNALNVIQYNVVGRNGSATVNVNVQ
jgi:hypothetical protein